MTTKCMVVLSGGQDSTTCLFWAKEYFDEVYAVTFDYMQRHNIEVQSARKIAKLAVIKQHEVFKIGSILKSTSPLTSDKNLETYSSFEKMSEIIGDRRELTFVPMRNDLFLTLAINYAVYDNIFSIITGVCQEDNANYSDCRRGYIDTKEDSSNWALGLERNTDTCISIHTPLMDLSKAESIDIAFEFKGCYAALGYSHTSYSGEFPPKTQDHATVLRAHGFEDANVPDPLIVRAYWEEKIRLPQTANYQKFLSIILPSKHIPEEEIYNNLLALEDKLRNNR